MTALLLALVLSLAPVYRVTGYTTADDETAPWSDGLTADGTPAEVGIDAACPPAIPLGAVLYVEGVGVRLCSDRGGAIKGRRLDVLVDTKAAALEMTRRARVVVLAK